ncbi:MAG: ABC transporter [Acidimicrobiales bacterium]|nr:MAG: ABC transporter [Acidimicrobiales bacterium]
MTSSQAALECDAITVRFGDRSVLNDLSVTVAPGEVVALLGANGAGKSTLVKAALGLVRLHSGTVRLLGSAPKSSGAAKRVGYVPQRLGAAGGVPATVREVVASGRLGRASMLRWANAADRAAVDTAMQTVGIFDLAKATVATLSGGQQQRVLIARAFAGKPDLLLLDEPTAGIDAASQQAFHDALATLIEREVTIVLVAHELGLLAPLISRVLVLHDGGIAFDGATRDAATEYLQCSDVAHRLAHVGDHPHPRIDTNLWGSRGV